MLRRGACRWRQIFLALGAALAAPATAMAATGGPPIGRVDESTQTTQAAPLEAAPQPPPPPPPAPAAAGPAPTEAPAPGKPRGKMPVVQRPEQTIDTTAIPGEVTPRTTRPAPPPSELKYVPGIRFILSGHRENYFISGASSN